MRYAAVFLAVLLHSTSVRAANVGHIQQCFTSVLPGQIAILDNDLNCPSYPGNEIPIIGLQNHSMLLLNGHTINGGDIGVGASGARARIRGPGTISGMAYGILTKGVLSATDVVLDGNGYGIYSPDNYRLKLAGVSVRNSKEYGITMGPTVLGTGAIKGENLTVDNNGKVGIEGHTIVIDNLHATGNGYSGVVGTRSVLIRGGTVTGNGTHGFALFERVDIASFLVRPKIPAVTCEHSVNDVGGSWGVCALDP